jgi:flagellar FliL protein
VVLGGGGGAYWYLKIRPAAAGQAAEAPEPSGPKGVVPFEPFVVNLNDPAGTRFLRVSLGLVTDTEDSAKELTENAVARMQLRSAILELLSQQSAEAIVTPDGKDALKKAIAARASHTVADFKVADVLFSEFVVQF